MNIIVEGPDGSGKTSLCRLLAVRLEREVIEGEGPSKYRGDYDARIFRSLEVRGKIFDRHSAVSGTIYGLFREEPRDIPSERALTAFYASAPVFIYCHPTGLTSHVPRAEVDTEEYLAWLEKYSHDIKIEYEFWALRQAHLIYRVGDDIERLVRMVERML